MEMNFSTREVLAEPTDELLDELLLPEELEELLEEELEDAFLAEEEVSAFMVTLPTVPSYDRPLRFWKALTAASVWEP